ncbi:MAG: hypothetical protein VCC00_15805 [Deltaproteobacteria bacterium]
MWTRILIVCAIAAMPSVAGAAPEGCGDNPDRPYVCDIGAPRTLSMQGFDNVMEKNDALRATVARIGKPDRAEIQRIRVAAPWSQWELRTYYRSLDRMFVYGRAFVLGSPEITLLRHESRIPGAMWEHWRGNPAIRKAKAAAERAAVAAERSAKAAERTARLAEAIADDAAADFPKRLMKQ